MSYVKSYFGKMVGGAPLPPSLNVSTILLSGLGAGLAIGAVLMVQAKLEILMMMAPLGASCFLAFALPDSPLAQPRNIIFGHLISSSAGLLVGQIWGNDPLAMALGVGLAVVAMLVTRTSHAPAGADPIVVLSLQPGWDFLINPVLSGSVVVAVVALLFNNLRSDVRYPKYW